jgi:hypothetical protein
MPSVSPTGGPSISEGEGDGAGLSVGDIDGLWDFEGDEVGCSEGEVEGAGEGFGLSEGFADGSKLDDGDELGKVDG